MSPIYPDCIYGKLLLIFISRDGATVKLHARKVVSAIKLRSRSYTREWQMGKRCLKKCGQIARIIRAAIKAINCLIYIASYLFYL